MKTELHHYAMSLNGEKLSGIPNLCVWILLSIFLIPTLIMNVWIGLTIIFLYLVLSLCAKSENDIYIKGLFKWGLFLLFFGIECLLLVAMRYTVFKSILISILILLVVYEIIFAFKIKQKVYSDTDKAQKDRSNILAFIFGGSGVYCGRMIANTIESTDIKLWIVIFLCSVLIVGSVSAFQKLLIYKAIKK